METNCEYQPLAHQGVQYGLPVEFEYIKILRLPTVHSKKCFECLTVSISSDHNSQYICQSLTKLVVNVKLKDFFYVFFLFFSQN